MYSLRPVLLLILTIILISPICYLINKYLPFIAGRRHNKQRLFNIRLQESGELDMKIGIMTWHYGANHGAILQAYALKKVIEDMGHETVLLPFERNMEHYVPRVISRDEKRLKYSIKGIERKLFHDKKKRIFKSFKNAYFKVVEKGTPVDAVCLGSDEVFDISGYTPDMFGDIMKMCLYAPLCTLT